MNAIDGVPNLPGLTDEGIALAAQILQQRADAHLVVVVGVLERGNLVCHQRLELGGARERPLDAVAHGGHFAPDRLADGDDRLARDRLRFRQPHRNLGHGLGDEPQFLRPPGHMSENVKENDRGKENRTEHGQYRCSQAGW